MICNIQIFVKKQKMFTIKTSPQKETLWECLKLFFPAFQAINLGETTVYK